MTEKEIKAKTEEMVLDSLKADIEKLTKEQKELYVLRRVVDTQYREFNSIYLYIRETLKAYMIDMKEISSKIFLPEHFEGSVRRILQIKEGVENLESIASIIHLSEMREFKNLKECMEIFEDEI